MSRGRVGLKEIVQHADPGAIVEVWSPEKVRDFDERMRATMREQAQEKQRRRADYMAQEVECPACKTKATISDIAVMKSNGIMGPAGASWIEYLKCRQCKVHFGPPDGEVVMTGHDRIDMSM